MSRSSMGWAALAVVLGLATSGCGGCGDGDDPPATMDGSMVGDGGPVDTGSDSTAGPACGDGSTGEGEVCDDGNTTDGDGCSADCQSDESCGNGIVDTAAMEVCDDSNGMSGDGCSADCRSNETCGNGIVDLAAGEVCDDSNTMDGDGCAADCMSGPVCGNGTVEGLEVCDDGNTMAGDGCSDDCASDETCGNSIIDGAAGEVCDDGNTTAGDGCNADCTSNEVCGNGVVDAGETCDDGNSTAGDGCENDCTYSCAMNADCDDSMTCNGVETCNTTTHACVAGTPAADGTLCGVGMICRAGACTTALCGNGSVEIGEECDDGNTTGGDGCENDCTWTCEVAADCADTNTCNGAETCNTTTHTCVAGTPAANGTACDRDMMPATRDICLASVCAASVCGDGYTDAMRMEQCDDGNTVSGDGCEAGCTLPMSAMPTAYRVTAMSLIDPHIYLDFFGCMDVTGTANTQLRDAINMYSLNFIQIARPQDLAMATNPGEAIADAMCTAGMPRASCTRDPMATVVTATINNMIPAASDCFDPIPMTRNPAYGGLNDPRGPCYNTSTVTITVSISGVPITLRDARIAATYGSGSPPGTLVQGVMVGFLTTADAMAVTFPASTPLIGGDTLYEHLADGRAPGSACASRSSFTTDDSDVNAGVQGFWFYLNFTAQLVNWTDP